jgi:hypothetical protein
MPMHLHRAATTGLTIALVLSIGACGGGDGGSDDDQASTPARTSSTTSSSSPSPTAPDEIDADELGGIVAGTPEDVTWRVPAVPSSWKKLPTDPGELQWQIRDTPCAVTLSQPAGLGTGPTPTQEEVLDMYATRTGKAAGSTLRLGSRGTTMLPLVSGSTGITASTKVSRATLAGGDGVQGIIYAYRSGDFALVMTAICGQAAYPGVEASDVRPFVRQLAVKADY